MAKRFTDSRKWDDSWFLDLPVKHKLFWFYLLDKCDHAGVYKINLRLASFCLGATLVREEIEKDFNGRIEAIGEDKWFVSKFVEFQYGELNPSVNCHKSVIKTLNTLTVGKQLMKGCSTLKDKDKDKDKDIKRVKDNYIKSNITSVDNFENLWIKYPNSVGKKQALRHFKSSVKSPTDLENIKKALDNYLKTDNVKRGFIQNGSTWFNNWQDYVNYVEPKKTIDNPNAKPSAPKYRVDPEEEKMAKEYRKRLKKVRRQDED